MKLYNYTAIKQKETKIYDIGGYKMSSGLSVDFLKIFLPIVGAFLIIGFLFSFLFNVSMFNPFSDSFSLGYLLFWLIFGCLIGGALWYVQFSGYRLYMYLLAYFRPKKTYSTSFKTKQINLHNYKIKGFVKNIL